MSTKSAARKKSTANHRQRARDKGGIIIYGMITNPEAIAAWNFLKEVYGSNRDCIEAALVDAHENMRDS